MKQIIMLLAIAAVSAAVIVLPSVALAVEGDIPLHMGPLPTSASSIAGGKAIIQTQFGSQIACKEVKGTATWENSTTGHIKLAFQNDCTFGEPCESVETTELQFHLVTLPLNAPGMLITTNAGHFATFFCGYGLVEAVLTGNGVIGVIVSPACGAESNIVTIRFELEGDAQKQKKVEGTATEYHLDGSANRGEKGEVGLSTELLLTFPEDKKTLQCT
ncbi:MAG TPA: hypothetical protein VFL77_07910 [Solirubrobacterales bacterium]|nr:hypothetical protein [Solirubrobacterales bacterium]